MNNHREIAGLEQPMTFRRQMRLAVLSALSEAEIRVSGEKVEIQSPGDWNIQQENLPTIIVRTAHENKSSDDRRLASFTTSLQIDIKATVSGVTAQETQSKIESLWYQIENAILMNYSVIRIIQRVSSIDTSIEINAEGQMHLAGITGGFTFEGFEAFDPTIDPPLATEWPVHAEPDVPLTELTMNIAIDADSGIKIGIDIPLEGA